MAGGAPNQVEDLGHRIAELERRLRALETAPRATNTSITGGTFKILDGGGTVRARLGLLADGVSYGLEVDDGSGTPLNIANSLLGVQVGVQSGLLTPVTTTFQSLSGAAITVTIGQTGKLLLVTGAFAWLVLDVNAAGDDINTDVLRDGTTAILHLVGGGAGRLKARNLPLNAEIAASICTTHVITGLTPGSHTFQLRANATLGVNNSSIQDGFIFGLPL